MLVRPLDEKAYRSVFRIETLLRRVLRWELRGKYGRQWLAALDGYFSEIESRIAAERRHALYDPKASELSYLYLYDLVDLIFDSFWDPIFRRVLSNHRSLRKDPLRTILSVRNKVAHFRPVQFSDLQVLSEGEPLVDHLRTYYSNHVQASAYLSGDPEFAMDQLESTESAEIIRQLSLLNLSTLWEHYVQLEGMRAHGLFPGIGVIDHHVFFEIYTRGAFLGDAILQWVSTHSQEVTFLNIGPTASSLRIFIPSKIDAKTAAKVFTGLYKLAKQCQSPSPLSNDELRKLYDLGSIEQLNAEGHNVFFSFVF